MRSKINNGSTLHIVGLSPDEIPVRDDHIRVYGYLRKDDPKDREVYDRLLESSRIFVCPMRMGPPPGVVREAQLMCTPVVMTNVSHARERVTNGYNGVLLDELAPENLAYHMNRLLEDDALWSILARNAHESIKETTWDRTASELLEAAWTRAELVWRKVG
jgi:glycosyltransferase involved in cell wall biosynthesis